MRSENLIARILRDYRTANPGDLRSDAELREILIGHVTGKPEADSGISSDTGQHGRSPD